MSSDREVHALERIADALERLVGDREQPSTSVPAHDMPERERPTPEPETSESDPEDNAQPTLDDLRSVVKQAAAVDRAQTVEVLKRYGASKAPEVAESDYAAAISDLQKVVGNAG